MKNITFFLIIMALIHIRIGYSQELTVGEAMPKTIFNNVWNHTTDEIDLKGYQGKFIVLDFWGTNCASCLEAFGFVKEMQSIFKKDIQFIAVNRKLDADSVGRFFEYRTHLQVPPIPFLTNDTLLYKLFPHQGSPHYVVLDREGKLLISAKSMGKSRETFDKLIDGDLSDFSSSANRVYNTTLFQSRIDSLPTFVSLIYNQIESSGVRLDPVSKYGNEFVETGRIEFLYKRAYENFFAHIDAFYPGSVVLDVNNADKYIEPREMTFQESKNWSDHNTYTYYCRIPKTSPLDIRQLMREDLNRYFGLKVEVSKRNVMHWVLRRNDSALEIATKGNKPENTFLWTAIGGHTRGKSRKLVNQPFSALTDCFKAIVNNKFEVPFRDETGIDFNIDFEMKGEDLDNADFERMKTALEPYGLTLVKEWILTDVIVLKE